MHADHGAGSVKVGRPARKRRQLFTRARRMAGLVQNTRADGCDLIAANDDGIGIAVCDRLCLRDAEASGARLRGLLGDGVLRGIRCHHVERQGKAGEERAPVGGRGGQKKSSHGA